MQESRVSSTLSMHWVPVVDDHGRTRLEVRWTPPTEALAPVGVTSHAA